MLLIAVLGVLLLANNETDVAGTSTCGPAENVDWNHARSMLKMDAYDKSFWAAVHNTDPDRGPCLTRMQRERAKVFIREAHASFRRILNESTEAV